MSTHNLDYKKVTDLEITRKMEHIRACFIELELEMERVLSGSRETSIAYTKLEESLMWSIKSLVVLDEKVAILRTLQRAVDSERASALHPEEEVQEELLDDLDEEAELDRLEAELEKRGEQLLSSENPDKPTEK